MPEVAQESHGRRHQGVVFWKLEFGRKDTTFEWRALWTFDQGFPYEHVIFGDGTCGDAIWWVIGEMLVFREQTLGGDRSHREEPKYVFERTIDRCLSQKIL